MGLAKAWTAIDRLSIIWKFGLSDKITRNFLQAAVVSLLIYGSTTLTLIMYIEKKLNGKCYELYRTNVARNRLRKSRCTATNLSLKQLKKDEQGMWDTVIETRQIHMTFSNRSFHTDMPVLVNLEDLTYNSSEWTQDVVWKICWKRWIIGMNRVRESSNSVLAK